MATVSQWTPFGVALDITATAGTVTRTSATQYTVKINVSWETYWSGAETNYGMKASSGGGSVTLNPSGTYSSGGSSSFTGTYSISGGGSATKTITVTFTNYIEDWQGNVTDSATKTVSFNVTVPASAYTVTFVNGLGTTLKTQTVSHGGNATPPSNPTRTGYTFNGWSGTYTNVTSNRTITATWQENKLTLNYYSNYATSAFEGALNTVDSSKNVKVWSGDFYYDNDYSAYGVANYSSSSGVAYMTRDGYTATKYWGTSTSGGTLIHEDTGYSTGQALAKALGKDLSNGNASVNVYAQWGKDTYTINYNANSGSGSMSPQLVEWQETFTISDNKFKKEGYKVIGWYLRRNTDNKWYVTGQGWKSSNEVFVNKYEKKLYPIQSELKVDSSWISDNESAKEFTFYAVWEIAGVIYIDNGTTFEPYLTYIDNGTEWELYLAYIDDGTEWNIIS